MFEGRYDVMIDLLESDLNVRIGFDDGIRLPFGIGVRGARAVCLESCMHGYQAKCQVLRSNDPSQASRKMQPCVSSL